MSSVNIERLLNLYGRVIFFVAVWFCFLCPKVTFGQQVTFVKDIAPIIFKNCTPCHRPNQIAPMPFTNFEEVSSYASMIKYVTEIKYMPPWKALKTDHDFEGKRGLSDEEITLISKWVKGGVVEGDPSKTPAVPTFDDTPKIKNPDVVFSMSEAFEQYGVYYDQFKVFVLPTNLTEEKAISAIEFIPGNTSIVRSCFISIETSDKMTALDEWDPTYGYFSFGEIGFVPNESRWYTWNPLKSMTVFPKGYSKRLPKNAKILLHVHYGPTGVPLKDSSELRLKYVEDDFTKTIQNVPLFHSYDLTNRPFEIPANKKIRFHSKFVVPFDLELRAVMPHSHLLGNTWEIFTMEPETKESGILLKIEDWDLKWKRQFDFTKPVVLKKGTHVHALAQYDNTLDNLSNPSDPPRSMTWGKRMFKELFLVYFELVPILENKASKTLFNPSMVVDGNFDFQFSTLKDQSLNLTIMDFKGEQSFSVFQNKSFTKGSHTVRIQLKDLVKGNCFIELKNGDDVVLVRHVFVNVDENFLD